MIELQEEFGLGELDPAAESAPITTRDGVVLHGDLYRADGKVARPAIVIRLPYGTARGYTYQPQVAQYLARHGFHTLVQAVRGKFRSAGDLTPTVHDVDDASDTIDWIAGLAW